MPTLKIKTVTVLRKFSLGRKSPTHFHSIHSIDGIKHHRPKANGWRGYSGRPAITSRPTKVCDGRVTVAAAVGIVGAAHSLDFELTIFSVSCSQNCDTWGGDGDGYCRGHSRCTGARPPRTSRYSVEAALARRGSPDSDLVFIIKRFC